MNVTTQESCRKSLHWSNWLIFICTKMQTVTSLPLKYRALGRRTEVRVRNLSTMTGLQWPCPWWWYQPPSGGPVPPCPARTLKRRHVWAFRNTFHQETLRDAGQRLSASRELADRLRWNVSGEETQAWRLSIYVLRCFTFVSGKSGFASRKIQPLYFLFIFFLIFHQKQVQTSLLGAFRLPWKRLSHSRLRSHRLDGRLEDAVVQITLFRKHGWADLRKSQKLIF